MKFKKLLTLAAALLVGGAVYAQTDVTASYIGDLSWIVNGGGHNHTAGTDNHKEANGKGWWNNQALPSGWHAFAAPGTPGESWTSGFGSAGVMMGRTMVLPAGEYTLSFEAFGTNATNSADGSAIPNAGDAVAFLTGEDNVDITNTTPGGNTFHSVSYTFTVATDNTAYEFGIKKLADDSKIDWCQIKNVTLTLNSTSITPVANNDIAGFTYSGSQTWHTNTWSVEGQSDGSRFQVPFHELWVASGGKLADATIIGSYTPTVSGVYKISAWVRAVNESGGDISGVSIFVGDTESDACSGSPVMNGNGRLGTYTAMADGVSGTPIEYGFKVKDASVNWLSFKNVVITYLGSLPEDEVTALIAQVPSGKMNAAIESNLSTAKSNLESVKSVANYNALSSAISAANTSIVVYEEIAGYNTLVAELSSEAQTIYADVLTSYNNGTATDATAARTAYANAVAVNKLKLERDKALALGMASETVATYTATTEADATTKLHELMVAEYNYVTTNYSYGVSLGTWTTVNAGDRNGQHWDGTDASKYSEQADGWGSDSWSCSYSQDLTLPAGNYVFKVAGRKSFDDAALTLTVTSGGLTLGTVNDFPNGDTGLGINTSGVTDFNAEDTYANSNNGRGWQWRYVKFTLADPATVTVAINGSATAKYNWVGFCNPTVQTDNADNVTIMEALVALNSAKTAATLTKMTANVGTNAFQYNETTNNALWSAYETAKSNADNFTLTATSTSSDVEALTTALNTAITNYNNQILNAPTAGVQYRLKNVSSAAWANKYYRLYPDAAQAHGAYSTKCDDDAKEYLAQAWQFTAASGDNCYTLSMTDFDGNTRYICTNKTGYNDGTATQIRTTTDASKALVVKVIATSTEGVWNLQNTEDNSYIGGQDAGLYSNSQNYSMLIEAATEASVTVSAKAGKYGTVIFPFTPDVSTGFNDITFYSCASVDGDAVELEVVATPVANVPYLIKNTGASDFSTTLTGWGTAAADSYTAGLLTGVYTAATIAASAGNTTNYVLQTQDDTQAFYKVDADFTATAYKCYLTVTESGEAKSRVLYLDGDATAISGINTEDAAINGAIYNVNGQQLNGLQRGINIVNGKKVLVK